MCHLILFLPIFALPIFWTFRLATALPLYLAIFGISFFLYFKIFKAMMSPVKTGPEAMLGKTGLVIEDLDPEGKIQYGNEIWYAVSRGGPLSQGEKVRIRRLRGLTAIVEHL